MYEVFFLSWDEEYAEQRWKDLKSRVSRARWVHGIKGIMNAHKECARLSRTSHFFVIDCDSEVIDFDVLKYRIPEWDKEYVHLWHSTNLVNHLEYGWGGVKLFPKDVFGDDMPLDMTTSLPLKIMPEVKSISHFNRTPFETWRSAFRESVKLTLKNDEESKKRLNIWMTVGDGIYGEYSVDGAKLGNQYAKEHQDDTDALMQINDYDWLKIKYDNQKMLL